MNLLNFVFIITITYSTTTTPLGALQSGEIGSSDCLSCLLIGGKWCASPINTCYLSGT